MARTTSRSFLALLIQGAADAGPIREALAQDPEGPVSLQCVERLSMALARIAGGGVDLLLVDVPAGSTQEGAIDSLVQLLREAPQVPVVVVCGADEQGIALKAVRTGAANYVLREKIGPGLCRVLRSVVDGARKSVPPATPQVPERSTDCGIIAFLGAKGGVGTTTVAFNIAAILARRSNVIFAEMRPTFGTLTPFLRPHGVTRNVSYALRTGKGAADPMEAADCLWAYKSIPGLKVLFAPQTVAQCAEIAAGQASAITEALARRADYLILDLASSLSEANRAVIEHSSSMVLVVERDPVCARSAALMASAVGEWSGAPQPIGGVIVNRSAVSCPMPLTEIDTLLGCQVLGVIPPAADLCLGAQNAGVPLVALQPESMVASCLEALSEVLAPRLSAVPRV